MNSGSGSDVDKPEVRLLADAADGDREARRQLFERYRLAAYQVAYRITGRNEDALDVVQDSFIAAFDKLDRFQHGASFKTWLLRIVTNRALDLLRSRKVRLAVSLDAGDEDDRVPALAAGEAGPPPLEQAELGERLRQALEALPPEQRAVIALYAEGEMTYGQIADALGIPIGTVMSRLYHARRRLRELLGELESG